MKKEGKISKARMDEERRAQREELTKELKGGGIRGTRKEEREQKTVRKGDGKRK